MSIDHYTWVPAGARNDKNLPYRKYSSYAALVAEHKGSHDQVFLAHGGPYLIDEQYFFEDPADAQWFWDEGSKSVLYFVDIDGDPSPCSADRMCLWLDDKKVASRDYKAVADAPFEQRKRISGVNV